MLIGWEEYNYLINCTAAVQLMIFPKQTKWRKCIKNTNVKWNCPWGTMKIRTKAPNFALTKELNENTNKSTKFGWKSGRTGLWRENSPRRLVQFWKNFQTSLVLLIPNCTHHRMITYTNLLLYLQKSGNTRVNELIFDLRLFKDIAKLKHKNSVLTPTVTLTKLKQHRFSSHSPQNLSDCNVINNELRCHKIISCNVINNSLQCDK
jgi:hypothetical protein